MTIELTFESHHYAFHVSDDDFAGNHWWIHTHIEDVPPEEIKKRAEAWMTQQKGG